MSSTTTTPSSSSEPQLPKQQQLVYTETDPLPPTNQLDPTPENINRVISVIGKAFAITPLYIAFITEIDNIPRNSPREIITVERCKSFYTDGITRVATSGGICAESGSFSAVAIWEPPDFHAADFSSQRETWTPIIREWTARVKAARIKHLGLPGHGQNPPLDQVTESTVTKLRPFWHLGFLARDPDAPKVPGAISAVVLPFLDRVRRDMVPGWLEAETETGVRMYEHFGFRLVETITLAVGKFGPDGWFEDGGEGVSGYCMIYDRHLR